MRVWLLVLASAVLLTACSPGPVETFEKEPIPVKTMEVAVENLDESLHYVGVVSIEEVTKVSFKANGRLLDIPVEQGDYVEAGQVLASLESDDLNFALDAALARSQSAIAQRKKALESFAYASDTLEKTKALYASGAVSQDALDKAQLNYDVQASDVNAAKQAVNQAQVDLDQKRDMVGESTMVAPHGGFVSQIIANEQELVQAGQPVVVLRSEEKLIKTGLSQRDINQMKVGMKVQACFDDQDAEGEVQSFDLIPDPDTRTYEVRIALTSTDVPIGAVGTVKFVVGQKEGIRIPITSIQSGTTDYVYVIEGDRAMKRTVALGEIDGVDVFVSGLEAGEELVVEGAKNLKNLEPVKRVNE